MAATKLIKVDKDFGARFYSAWMQSKHWECNQKELSVLFDVSQQTVSSWIHSTRYPFIDTGIQIAREFNVNMDWLYVGRLPKHPLDPLPYVNLAYRLINLSSKQFSVIDSLVGMFEKDQVTTEAVQAVLLSLFSAKLNEV